MGKSKMTYPQFMGLLTGVEELVSDLATMREDDPTRPGVVDAYKRTRAALVAGVVESLEAP